MKLLSKCEREFIVNCIVDKQKRLDGRSLLEGRTIEIVFSQERGCCTVLLGNTRVLSQVTAEVSEPRNKPSEGALHVNLELSSMATPDLKGQSRISDEAIESQRALERCIRDSKCIDLESLCIVVGSKVWTIRVDIHALNDDGNLIECASIAAIAALAHFRRPDVTVIGTEVTVHSLDEREPVPLNLHHMPINVNLAIFEQGDHIVVDPIDIEEKVADGCYIIGINAHQELCYVHRRGSLLLKEDAIELCENIAVKRAQTVTQAIRSSLDDDAYKRATNVPVGFANMIKTDTILGCKRSALVVNLDTLSQHKDDIDIEVEKEDTEVHMMGDNSEAITYEVGPSAVKERVMKILQEPEVAVFEGGHSKWIVKKEDESDESSEAFVDFGPDQSVSVEQKLDVDSEEEAETFFVNQEQVDVKPGSRGWYTKDPFM